MTRRILVWLVCVTVSLIADVASAAPSVPRINWSPCYKDFGPFECGTVQVPLDYSRPAGAAVSIAMIRLPALDQSRRIGSLFINPGGPGGSGVNAVLFAALLFAPPAVLTQFDLVGFDPRGVGRSTTLRCFGNVNQALATVAPFPFPATPQEEALWIAGDLALVESCDQRGSRIHDFMSTADVARDLDLLRQAVGDDRLTYAGYSYGSYLGVTYANLFPDKVRALVVDGVLDPIAWSTGIGNESDTVPFSTRLRSAVGAQHTLEEFFRLCDAGLCAFRPNSGARFASLALALQAAPLRVNLPDGTTFFFTYQLLIANALNAMYDSSSWPAFAGLLFALETLADASTLGAQFQAFSDQIGLVTKRGFPHYPSIEAGARVLCSDTDNPTDYAAWPIAAATDLEGGYFAAIWTWGSSVCAKWGGPTANRFAGPFTAATANPVLVIGNLFDPATPYHGAHAVKSLLPNSALLTMQGWGHTSLGLSRCVAARVAIYLITLATPPAGAVCQQDFVPFAPPVTASFGAGSFSPRHELNHLLMPDMLRRTVP